ncbi:hypothetical protein SAMN02745157_4035 [Kaistia soli DSM 19436]|uniref:HNH endonuclease n=1 Tax=Kaistia soli DSM 19436 TaxID=1122133 RepID=A0A1M5IYJ5_9HYPH|nr:hypothetical protein [Kaistia soli]SHG33119.1 hypothetical protein SAMN02745157_4035 [Kaistia soli DSM 19436]
MIMTILRPTTARIPRRPVIHTTDTDGRPIVLVPLSSGARAKLFPRHYERLQRMGIGRNWFLNDNGQGLAYVRAKVPTALGWGNNAQVARLIACPSKRGASVSYRDGDRLNLRLDNLQVTASKGRGKGREQFLPDDAEPALEVAA